MPTMDEAIVSRLRDTGFSLYEARLYLALLRTGAQNGNEVASQAGVPSSKVYSALEKLAGEGIVHASKHGNSTRFTAIPPTELIPRLRKQYNDPLDFLEGALPKVVSVETPEPFLTISGDLALRETARSIVQGATKEITLSCWEDELSYLEEPLVEADKRGVIVRGMLYGEAETPPGKWMRHHYVDIVGQRVSGRLLAIVADESDALIARIPDNGESTAVRSSNPVMTLIVQEYLHHDTMLQRAQISIGFDEWDRWWQADPESRAEIFRGALRQSVDDPGVAGEAPDK
jgi:sugar-specific transcriptional regulator TrmB